MLYWPEFEFDFRLDAPRLFPHIAAVEALQQAACNRIVPPAWRELPDSESPQADTTATSNPELSPINLRKRELLVTNKSQVQIWVRNRFRPGTEKLSLEDILTMHQLVAEETGVYYKDKNTLRTAGVQVGRREVGGIHVGAPPERLQVLMEQYVQFINGQELTSFPPAIHSLVAHFFFTTIHPFDDGNGRVSRLVSAAILFKRGYNGHGFYALSNYFYHHDIKYHSLLHQCWQMPLPFDLTAFVAFGIEGLVVELQGISNFLRVKRHRASASAM
ncbi:MAG TPA: Fic family protein [Candidatus Angelobacter sp.]|nr:Fic family protein [Candidatus Angelobacter sp.]